MRPNEHARLLIAFSTLLVLTLAAKVLNTQIAIFVAILMSLGCLPALMLHWVRPARAGTPTLAAAAMLALPGLALTLGLWHDFLVARGITPVGPLAGVALLLVFVQAISLRAESGMHLAAMQGA